MKKYVLVALLAVSASAAMAGPRSDTGPYISGSLSRATQPDIAPSDTTKSGGSVVLGMQVARDWAVEVGYNQLGSRSLGGENWQWEALTLSTVGRLDLSQSLSLVGKLGIARTAINAPEAFSTHMGLSQTGYVYGVGLDYKISKAWTTRVMLEKYPQFAGSDTDLHNASIGVQYKF